MLVPLLQSWLLLGEIPWHWLIALLSMTLLHALVLFLALRRGYLAGGALAGCLIRHLIRHMPRVSPSALQRVVSAESLLRGPVQQSMGIPAHLLGPLLSAVITPACVVLGLVFIDWTIAIGLLLAGLLLALLLRWCARRNLEAEEARLAAERDFTSQLQAFAQHQVLLRAADRAGEAHQRLEFSLENLYIRTRRLLIRSLPAELALSLSVQVVFALMLFVGAWAVTNLFLDGARLVAVLVLLVRFIDPLTQLSHFDQALRGALQALDTLAEVFELPALESPRTGKRPKNGSLRAEALEYRLKDGRALLTGVDMYLTPGTLTAIVGPSGAGKSCLLALLARLDDPDGGRVLLGDVDLRNLDEDTLAASRNLVFQNNGLFRGSVAWNLSMAKSDASSEVMRMAADQAAILVEIESWPQGWESDVGPGGSFLSGGQRQRLCLARGFLSEAPVLLLDEPTAALDAYSERQLIRSLLALRGHRTVLVVTHQPALARVADQVLILEGGCIRLSGTYAELFDKDVWFKRFVHEGEPA